MSARNPGTSAPIGCCKACAPPVSAEANSRRPVELAFLDRHHIACASRQTLFVLQLSQLGRSVDLDIGVGTDAKSSSSSKVIRAIEDAVAE